MLITLITIAIASLAATPLVAPAVKRFVNRSTNGLTKEEAQEQKASDTELATDDITEALREVEQDHIPKLSASPPVIPQFSLELIKPVSRADTSTEHSNKTNAKPLVEVVWKASSGQQKQVRSANTSPSRDQVESFRHTPSADKLFSDSNQDAQVFESANKQDPPRLIIPNPSAVKPKAARQITPLKIKEEPKEKASEATIEPSSTVLMDQAQAHSTKRYQVGAEKFKMNPVSAQAPSSKARSTAIPMFITATPTAVNNDQHFEVIKPQKKDKAPSFSLIEQPELFASGERAWRGVQPLYIDFSPFFSLDSLMEISPRDSHTQSNARRKSTRANRGRLSRSSSRQDQLRSVSIDAESAINPLAHMDLLRDLNSEVDRYLHPSDNQFDEDDFDEEEYEWNEHQQTSEADYLENVPEWESLLSLGNHFLFDMKLNQKRLSQHQELTDQKLEDAIVFKITSGGAGPEVHSQTKQKNEQNRS